MRTRYPRKSQHQGQIPCSRTSAGCFREPANQLPGHDRATPFRWSVMVPCTMNTVPGLPIRSWSGPNMPPAAMVTLRIHNRHRAISATSNPHVNSGWKFHGNTTCFTYRHFLALGPFGFRTGRPSRSRADQPWFSSCGIPVFGPWRSDFMEKELSQRTAREDEGCRSGRRFIVSRSWPGSACPCLRGGRCNRLVPSSR